MELSPVKTTLRIALVGDYNPDVIAHQAIPLAIDDAAAVLELTADYDWLATPELTSPEDLVGYDAIWLVPASPYKNTEAAFIAARYARENSIPFLGTCGGFQHALIEYARNVLARCRPCRNRHRGKDGNCAADLLAGGKNRRDRAAK